MKKTLLLSAMLTTLLAPLPMVVAHAQTQTGGVDDRRANTRANRRGASDGKAKAAEPVFPNATREEPKQSGTPSLAKKLNRLFELQEQEKNDEAIAAADEILADGQASAFDKSTAAYIAGYAWLAKDTESYANSSKYINRAITENGLSNNTHYQMMLQLAQMQVSEEKYAEGLATITRYINETKKEDTRAYALQGNALYRLNRYAESVDALKKAMATQAPGTDKTNLVRLLTANYMDMDKPLEAAKTLEELLAQNPSDKTLLQNLASVYQQAEQDAKAGEIIDRMHKQGLLTEAKDYEAAYKLMANIPGREKDAVAMINEGLAKGILQPSHDVYAYIGNAYYNADQIPQAIEAWSKAAPLGKDGETYLNIGKLQASEEKWAEAKAAAQKALAKGVRKPGDAWLVVARAEFGMGNKPAVLAAYREAAKYPETKAAAEKALRQAAGK